MLLVNTFTKGMEIIHNEIAEGELNDATINRESGALDVIRTETVLSRLPIHNLAKKGNVNIQILKTTPDGKVELKWIVSYSDRYGQARQLAYKLDTIVINHHIDEQGRPLPKMICLGSLRDVADQLDLGGDTNKVRRALRQNASAFITAKFEYRGNDGSKKTLEADFTRYSVVFTGEQLPDGRRADAVYIILNEPYREVLNNAPVRPLDRAYMKALPPAAQRFYEIISYKIFSAIKNDYPHAKIAYSEYCTFSAQLRHFERQPVQDQMAKVLRPHKASGYITGVKYVPTINEQNQPDWIMYLTPGPKAHAEFAVAHGRRTVRKGADGSPSEVGESQADRHRIGTRERQFKAIPAPAQPAVDPSLLSEFTRRGITEKKALALLANVKPGQNVIAQLELGEQMVKASRIPILNPPGFYITLIESNTLIPEGFVTSAVRQAREEQEQRDRKRRTAEDARQLLENEYDDYCQQETSRYIEENPAILPAITETKWRENRERFESMSDDLIMSMAESDAYREIRKQVPRLTFEEFAEHKKHGTDFSLKLVSVSPAAEAASVTPPPVDAIPGEPTGNIAQSSEVSSVERGEDIESPPEPATEATISEPAIELASEMQPELGGDPAQPGLV
jgi:hypothetical protein